MDQATAAAGVRVGMKPALVRSLLPGALLLPREPARETALLHTLACWAGNFTPRLSLWPEQGLLLEIGSCLRLFGGLEALVQQVVSGLSALGFGQGVGLNFALRHALAPTAQGAAWLALAGADGSLITDNPASALDPLRLAHLAPDLPPGCLQRLSSFGLRTLGEVRRLPGDALTRRIGADLPTRIRCAYGQQAESLTTFVFPEHFAQGLELPAAMENTQALLFASRRLLQALAGWLTARQGGIRQCRLLLGHHRRPATVLLLRFAEPLRDPERMADVLRERLTQWVLTAPVESLGLEVDAVAPLAGHNQTLFAREGACPEGIAALSERLRARLGEAQVFALAHHADHRPEAASRRCEVAVHPARGAHPSTGQPAATPPKAPRPLWLLPTPKALTEHQGRPHHRGPLQLLSGPERIESGWWDGGEGDAPGDLRRDYYVALTPDQCWLWIYRDWRAPGGWFLHGYFA